MSFNSGIANVKKVLDDNKDTPHLLGGKAAGLTSTVLGHPLDCVKVRLQTTPGQTTLGCASQMLRAEGPLVFARGLGPPLANAVALNTVMFVAFAEAQKSLPSGTFGSLLAGAFSGVVQAFFTTPLDLLKIQAQLRGGSSIALLAQVVTNSDMCATFAGCSDPLPAAQQAAATFAAQGLDLAVAAVQHSHDAFWTASVCEVLRMAQRFLPLTLAHHRGRHRRGLNEC